MQYSALFCVYIIILHFHVYQYMQSMHYPGLLIFIFHMLNICILLGWAETINIQLDPVEQLICPLGLVCQHHRFLQIQIMSLYFV